MADKPRIYGMADDQEPPAPQGVRGEQAGDGDPQFGRAIRLESGRTVVVRQGSGVSYAEATGRIGRAPAETEQEQERSASEPSVLPIIAAALGGFVIGGMLAGYASRQPLRQQRDRALERRIAASRDIGGGVGYP